MLADLHNLHDISNCTYARSYSSYVRKSHNKYNKYHTIHWIDAESLRSKIHAATVKAESALYGSVCVVHRHHFSSTLQRMSVVCVCSAKVYMYTYMQTHIMYLYVWTFLSFFLPSFPPFVHPTISCFILLSSPLPHALLFSINHSFHIPISLLFHLSLLTFSTSLHLSQSSHILSPTITEREWERECERTRVVLLSERLTWSDKKTTQPCQVRYAYSTA